MDPEQDNFQIFHSSQAEGGSNYVSYANPEADRLMEQLRTRFDSKERAGLERALHRLLYRDQVYDFLSRRPLLDAVSKRVHGIAPALTWYDLRKVWIE